MFKRIFIIFLLFIFCFTGCSEKKETNIENNNSESLIKFTEYVNRSRKTSGEVDFQRNGWKPCQILDFGLAEDFQSASRELARSSPVNHEKLGYFYTTKNKNEVNVDLAELNTYDIGLSCPYLNINPKKTKYKLYNKAKVIMLLYPEINYTISCEDFINMLNASPPEANKLFYFEEEDGVIYFINEAYSP